MDEARHDHAARVRAPAVAPGGSARERHGGPGNPRQPPATASPTRESLLVAYCVAEQRMSRQPSDDTPLRSGPAPGGEPVLETHLVAGDNQPLRSGPAPGGEPVSLEYGTTLLQSRTEVWRAPAAGPISVQNTRYGRYTLLEHLGAGGMGVVFAAYDPDLDRRVALKLLRGGQDTARAEASERMLREAKALARLSHPHVVAVHDVGVVDGDVFIAMELVEDGVTLRRWLERPRPWREVLDGYRRAGEGLAAAHQAGIVHRDFKPDNVLMGKDGRVRVMDFGLAVTDARDAGVSPGADAIPAPDAGPDQRLTVAGTVMGTPVYMAPEQHMGMVEDGRSDQYAFCVSLYEGLYGHLPYRASSLDELVRSKQEGRILPPALSARVPRWVHESVLRGMAPRPEDRWPSMEALLDRLSRDPRRARLWFGGVVAAAALAGTLAALWPASHPDPAAVCRGGAERFARVWSPQRKAAIQEAFLTLEVAHAGPAWTRLAQAIDAYGDEWIAVHTETCEATHVRGEQSAELLDLRMLCLAQRLDQVDALAGMLASPGDEILINAGSAVGSLAPVRECADVRNLTSQAPLPADPEARANLARVSELVAASRALAVAGKINEARQRARSAVDLARVTGYEPASADALLQLADVHVTGGAHEQAVAELQKAVTAAEAGRAQYAKLRASLELARVNASFLQQPAEAERWLDYAQAISKLLGDVPGLRHRVSSIRARIAWLRDELGRAEALYREAIALASATEGERSAAVGELLTELGAALGLQGKIEEAILAYQSAREILEEALSPEHPHVARALQNLGNEYVNAGRLAEARPLLQRAIDIYSKASGAQHLGLAFAYDRLGMASRMEGDYAQAILHFDRALRVLDSSVGPAFPMYMSVLIDKAHALLLEGRYAEALPLYQRQLESEEPSRGKSHPRIFPALVELADAEAMLGMTAEARAHLERALPLFGGPPGKTSPWADLVQASLLWHSPEQRRQAVRMVENIRAGAPSGNEADSVLLRQRIERWLATHPRD
jgi:tetratricopeptide (TPR) repeat protein